MAEFIEIKSALMEFWGHGSGSMDELAAVEALIKKKKVSKQSIKNELLPSVPASATGHTGARCKRAIAMLHRLAGA